MTRKKVYVIRKMVVKEISAAREDVKNGRILFEQEILHEFGVEKSSDANMPTLNL